jgi:glycosyltransferase involved in cell wall biosynthesis
MRILFLSSSGHLGGAERLLLDLLGVLRRLHPDWALHLAAVEPGPFISEAGALGVKVEVLALPPILAGLGEAGLSPLAMLGRASRLVGPSKRYVNDLRAHVEQLAPDVVHSNGLKTHLLAAWAVGARRPLVWHLHDYVGSRRVTSRLLTAAARRADLAIANSKSVADDAARVFGDRLPVVVVSNAVDVTALASPGPELDLDRASGLDPAPAGSVRIGLMATFARWKGHLVFLDALSRLPGALPVRAYIIGGPVYQTAGSQFTAQELRDRSRALGLDGRVGFTGFQQDRRAVLKALDVVVHASTSPEPFGLVIAEAMAAGRPVITSALGGAAELVRPGLDALTWNPPDPATLTNAMERLVSDPSLRSRLGAAARTVALEKFGPDRLALGVIAAHARAIARRTGDRG